MVQSLVVRDFVFFLGVRKRMIPQVEGGRAVTEREAQMGEENLSSRSQGFPLFLRPERKEKAHGVQSLPSVFSKLFKPSSQSRVYLGRL